VVQGGATSDAPTIAAVAVAGNNHVDEDDIVDGLANRPPERENLFRKVYRRLDRLALEQDIARIETYYHKRGFYSAKVVGTDIEPDGGDNEVRVTFQVSEGQPTRISGMAVLGLSGGLQRSATLTDKLDKFRRGKVFRHDEYAEISTNWLAHRGFPHGIVEGEVDVDRDAHTAFIVLRIDRGPYARFRNTIIRGLERVPESAVRNRLAWEPGESMRLEKLQLTQGRLYQLGLFSSVRTDFEKKGRPRRTDIYLSLTEAARHELRLGGGVEISGGFDPSNIRIELHQRTSYLMRGVFSPLATLRLEARPGWEWRQNKEEGNTNAPVGEATATLERQDLFLPRMTGQVTGGFEQSQLSAYVARGPLARLGLSRPFVSDLLQVQLGWRLRYLDFLELSDALDGLQLNDEAAESDSEKLTRENIGLVEPYRLAALEQTISFDWRRPSPLDPRYGVYASVAFTEGAAAVGGDLPFLRVTGDARGYTPILRVLGFRDPKRRLVLAGRAFYGRALGSDPLPLTERFFDGGSSGHRGFAYQQLSPSVTEDGDPPEGRPATARIGGEEQFLGSAEVRLDIADIKSYPFGIVLFTDAGDVVQDVGKLRLSKLHYAAGIGLRWSPVVAIRLDFAYRLNRHSVRDGDPVPNDRFAFHFSLGQAF